MPLRFRYCQRSNVIMETELPAKARVSDCVRKIVGAFDEVLTSTSVSLRPVAPGISRWSVLSDLLTTKVSGIRQL
jgi:hypothetical protein